MAANDYRGYLRNHMDMEPRGEMRFQPAQGAHRPLIFGTLAVMGLLQVASSVTILLHLTGYLREVDLSSAQPVKEVPPEPVIADALRDLKKNEKCRKKDQVPVAHLSVIASLEFANADPLLVTTVHWDQSRGFLRNINYHDGRLVMKEQGWYYVYAKTCFRYAPDHATQRQDVSNLQLFQYIFHEMHTQTTIRPVRLSKSGGTMQWNDKRPNMYCVQQGRTAQLKQSDGLFVNVSNSWLLDPEPEGTYFGAYKIIN